MHRFWKARFVILMRLLISVSHFPSSGKLLPRFYNLRTYSILACVVRILSCCSEEDAKAAVDASAAGVHAGKLFYLRGMIAHSFRVDNMMKNWNISASQRGSPPKTQLGLFESPWTHKIIWTHRRKTIPLMNVPLPYSLLYSISAMPEFYQLDRQR